MTNYKIEKQDRDEYMASKIANYVMLKEQIFIVINNFFDGKPIPLSLEEKENLCKDTKSVLRFNMIMAETVEIDGHGDMIIKLASGEKITIGFKRRH